jgi:hypothetical protein
MIYRFLDLGLGPSVYSHATKTNRRYSEMEAVTQQPTPVYFSDNQQRTDLEARGAPEVGIISHSTFKWLTDAVCDPTK